MNDFRSIVEIKMVEDYGRVVVKLAECLDIRNITRNKLRTLTGIKYDVIDRYYKNKDVERVDLTFIAKVCFILNCDISDLLEYQK